MLPRIGFGWVSDDQVLDLEHEDISESNLRLELKMKASLGEESWQAFAILIEHVGRHLSYLDVSGSFVNGHDEGFLPSILKHCVNLEHLVMVDIEQQLSDDTMDELLNALHGNLGGHLLSLDVNKNEFSDRAFQKLAEFLADPTRIPALQELRLLKRHMTPEAIFATSKVLRVNKRLRCLELMKPDEALLSDETKHKLHGLYVRVEEEYQGELLPYPLPLTSKLAFLSAIGHHQETTRGALDSFMVGSIFKFAAEDARRRVFWRDSQKYETAMFQHF